MIAFSLQDLMNYESCSNLLASLFHPEDLHCPCGQLLCKSQSAHKYRKNGLACYQCRVCKKVFNQFTNTILSGIHYDCITIVLMLHGFVQGKTTQLLSKELDVSYNNLLSWRHKLQEFAFENRDWSVLIDKTIESDEVFINAGEKGDLHSLVTDPPRVRANKKRG